MYNYRLIKHFFFQAGFFVSILMISTTGWSQDYRQYSDEDLTAMIGTMHNTESEDQIAFREEMKKRFNSKDRKDQQENTQRENDERNYHEYHRGHERGYHRENSGGGC